MKQKTKSLFMKISETQMDRLNKLSDVSMKSKASLIREAIELLFTTPGGKIL